jgi:hypothetical protein
VHRALGLPCLPAQLGAGEHAVLETAPALVGEGGEIGGGFADGAEPGERAGEREEGAELVGSSEAAAPATRGAGPSSGWEAPLQEPALRTSASCRAGEGETGRG